MAIRLLPLNEAAERLGVSVRTVRTWASRRVIPVAKIGRRVLVPEADLEAWITARKCEVRDPVVEARRLPR